MKGKNTKLGLYFIITIILTFGLSISFQNLLADWAPPGENPPAGNMAKPISSDQYPATKDGTLWIGGDNYDVNQGEYGLLVEQGNVGIGTTNPTVELDVVGDLNVSGTIAGDGSGLTSVPWGSLSNMPAGFSDGVDNIGSIIPSGFCVFSSTQSSCPSGWTRSNSFDGRTIAGASSPGSTGGSSSHTHTTANHALTVNEIPAHSHAVGPRGDYATGGSRIVGGINGDNTYAFTSGTTGGGQSHNHGNTGSASSWPPYINVIICCKN